MDLEAGRRRTGFEDIFIGYHAGDHVQATYAGASFHIHRSYYTSSIKRNVSEKKATDKNGGNEFGSTLAKLTMVVLLSGCTRLLVFIAVS